MQTQTAPNGDILFFDTETSDIPDWKSPSDSPDQPHLVEIAGLLYSRDGKLIDKYQAYVRVDGWAIAPEASEKHGLTEAFLAENGIDEGIATAGFLMLKERAGVRVAHNRNFDDRMLRIAIKRYMSDEAAEQYKAQPGECTALLSKPVCKLPPSEAMAKTNFKNTFKTPTLEEAFTFLTGGKVLENAHSAMADAQACARVYFALKGVRMEEFPNDLPPADGDGDDMPTSNCGNACAGCQHDEEPKRVVTELVEDGARAE